MRLRVAPQTWEAFRLTAQDGLPGAEAAARIGLAEGESFVAKVTYPKGGVPYGPYRRGENLQIQVPPRAVVVLEVFPAKGRSPKNRPPVSKAVPVDKAFLGWKEIPWQEIRTEP